MKLEDIQGGLESLEMIKQLEYSLHKTRNIKGDILNFGVYQGWSMYFILDYLKSRNINKKVIGFDTFKGFDKESVNEFCEYQKKKGVVGWSWFKKKGFNFFQDTSLQQVHSNLEGFHNYELVEGFMEETYRKIKDYDISLAFLDFDIYVPTLIALYNIYPRLSKGGIILHDHYSKETLCDGACIGQRNAMEHFTSHKNINRLKNKNIFIKK